MLGADARPFLVGRQTFSLAPFKMQIMSSMSLNVEQMETCLGLIYVSEISLDE